MTVTAVTSHCTSYAGYAGVGTARPNTRPTYSNPLGIRQSYPSHSSVRYFVPSVQPEFFDSGTPVPTSFSVLEVADSGDNPSDSYESEPSSFSYEHFSSQAEFLIDFYMGDLYRDSNRAASGSATGGHSSAPFSADELLLIDSLNGSQLKRPVPRSAFKNFLFSVEDTAKYFTPKSLARETLAFGQSMRAPNQLSTNSYKSEDKPWEFISNASFFAACLAAFATALSDLLNRADELGVLAVHNAAIRSLLVDINALTFAQAIRIDFQCTQQRRNIALRSLGLTGRSIAVDTIPSTGPHLFGDQFLKIVDDSFSMSKRASDIANKLRPTPKPMRSFRSFCGRASRAGPSYRERAFGSTRGFRGGAPRRQ